MPNDTNNHKQQQSSSASTTEQQDDEQQQRQSRAASAAAASSSVVDGYKTVVVRQSVKERFQVGQQRRASVVPPLENDDGAQASIDAEGDEDGSEEEEFGDYIESDFLEDEEEDEDCADFFDDAEDVGKWSKGVHNAACTKPTQMTSKEFTFHEAMKDSPNFRFELGQHERYFDRMQKRLEETIRSIETVIDQGQALNSSFYNLTVLLNRLWQDMGINEDVKQKPAVETYRQLLDTLTQVISLNRALVEHAYPALKAGFDTYLKRELGKLSDVKTHFNSLSASLSEALSKKAGISRNKVQELHDSENALTAIGTCFSHTELDYVAQINIAHALKCPALLEALWVFVKEYGNFFTRGSQMFAEQQEFLVGDAIMQMRTAYKQTERKMQDRHTFVPKVTYSRSVSSLNDRGGGGAMSTTPSITAAADQTTTAPPAAVDTTKNDVAASATPALSNVVKLRQQQPSVRLDANVAEDLLGNARAAIAQRASACFTRGDAHQQQQRVVAALRTGCLEEVLRAMVQDGLDINNDLHQQQHHQQHRVGDNTTKQQHPQHVNNATNTADGPWDDHQQQRPVTASSTTTTTTPLHIAVENNQTTMIEFLLLNGAKINGVDGSKNTPLHLAAERGHTIVVYQLLKRNAEKMHQNVCGRTALELAVDQYHADIVTQASAAASSSALNDGEEASREESPMSADLTLRDHQQQRSGSVVEPSAIGSMLPTLSVSSADSAGGGLAGASTSSCAKQKMKRFLKQLLAIPGNDRCADCGCPDAKWTSLNIGAIICIECSGVHRSLGVHFSKVRSLMMDTLETEHRNILLQLGNRKVNAIFLRNLPNAEENAKIGISRHTNRESREQWIIANVVYQLLKRNAEKMHQNVCGRTALELAVDQYHADIVTLLRLHDMKDEFNDDQNSTMDETVESFIGDLAAKQEHLRQGNAQTTSNDAHNGQEEGEQIVEKL
uniref:Arf-GAP domain-containing protein n=1 Tax=Globodera pallida TaxID=36090 RepID=A0A183BSQ4_GLOPA